VTGITKATPYTTSLSALPTIPVTPKKNRPGKNERLRRKTEIKKQKDLKYLRQKWPEADEETLFAVHSNPGWHVRPDWPETPHHCKQCHFTSEGEYHWSCSKFPGLDETTCPVCNASTWVDIFAVNPWLSLIDSPCLVALTPLARRVRDFFQDYNQYKYYQDRVVDLVLLLIAVLLVKTLL